MHDTPAPTPTPAAANPRIPQATPARRPFSPRTLRSLALTLPVLLLVACASSPGGPGASAASLSDDPIDTREVTLTIFGLSCPLCATNIDAVLAEVPGVTRVSVDMSTGKAIVWLDGKTPVTPRQLARAVDRSGFTLQSIDTP